MILLGIWSLSSIPRLNRFNFFVQPKCFQKYEKYALVEHLLFLTNGQVRSKHTLKPFKRTQGRPILRWISYLVNSSYADLVSLVYKFLYLLNTDFAYLDINSHEMRFCRLTDKHILKLCIASGNMFHRRC